MRWNIHFVWSIYLFSMVCFCKEGRNRDKRRPSKSMTSLVHEVCMPPDSDRLVYRYMNDSHIFIGFDDIQRDTVYYMLWKISKVNSEALINESPNEFMTMPGIEARDDLKKEHLLAASNQNCYVGTGNPYDRRPAQVVEEDPHLPLRLFAYPKGHMGRTTDFPQASWTAYSHCLEYFNTLLP